MMKKIFFTIAIVAFVLPTNAKKIATGNHSLVIKEDGSLWSWGNNSYGQLGDGTKEDRSIPIRIMENVVQVAVGSNHTLAIKTDGSLWAWGRNFYGQLGNGESSGIDQTYPVKIMDGVVQVAAGNAHTLAIKTDGSLWAWGHNYFGQLGNGDVSGKNQNSPVKIMDGVVQVAAGSDHTLAIRTNGSLWAWGSNSHGQLGNGESGSGKNQFFPAKIMDGGVQVAAGSDHTLAIKTDGSLWVWGDNYRGLLGNGESSGIDQTYPIKIMDDVVQISSSSYNSFAISADNTLYAWGYNDYLGILVDGTNNSTVSPVNIYKRVAEVDADSRNTIFLTLDGDIFAFGDNSHGQLGQGTKNYSETPVFIMNSGTQKTITEYAVDGVTYMLRSDNTAQVKTITADRVDLVIPSTITYDSIHYDVTALGDSIFYNDISNYYIYSVTFPASIKEVSEKAFWYYKPSAIVWKSNVALPANSFNNLNYIIQNFLLYVNSANIAPSGIKNLVVNGTAEEIVLKNEYVFNCPQEFTAKKISYTHNYNMETGYKECAGWETIALPFDVQTITHATKGELTPFASWISGSNSKPFWLYSLSSNGFVKASKIEANTPYIISMPNHSSYSSSYNVCGEVTFSATNSKVYRTGDDYQKSTTYDGAEFWPCYSAYNKSSNLYALNVTNDFFTYSGGEKPGSTFISNYRQIYPFEARFWKKTTNTRSIVIKFADDNTTDMKNILKNENKIDKIAIYTLGGTLVKCTNKHEFDQIWKGLSKGVYIVNGEKWIK